MPFGICFRQKICFPPLSQQVSLSLSLSHFSERQKPVHPPSTSWVCRRSSPRAHTISPSIPKCLTASFCRLNLLQERLQLLVLSPHTSHRRIVLPQENNSPRNNLKKKSGKGKKTMHGERGGKEHVQKPRARKREKRKEKKQQQCFMVRFCERRQPINGHQSG